jgi:hypothetical protein
MDKKDGRELKGGAEAGVGSLRTTYVSRPSKRHGELRSAIIGPSLPSPRLSKELMVVKKAIDGRKR